MVGTFVGERGEEVMKEISVRRVKLSEVILKTKVRISTVREVV